MTVPEGKNSGPLVGSLGAILKDALQSFDRGDLGRAEEILRQVVEAYPDTDTAWHIRGLNAQRGGKLELALECLREASRQAPDNPAYNRDLGAVCLATDRIEEAQRALKNAMELAPEDPAVRFHLANTQTKQREFEDAVANYQWCLEKQPDAYEVYSNLSVAQRHLGASAEAIAAAAKALELRPNFSEAANNLGLAHCDQNSYPEAIASFRIGLRTDPDDTEIMNNLGVALQANNQFPEAEAILTQVTTVRPDWPEAWINLGNLRREQGQIDNAADCYQKAYSIAPDNLAAMGNLGIALLNLNRPAESETIYKSALKNSPDNADLRMSLGISQLMQANYAEGWVNYEARWEATQVTLRRRSFSADTWKGERLDGKTLLVYAEQGFGDTLQFCRYVPLLSDLGAEIHFECQRPLVDLCENLRGVESITGRGDKLPETDFCIPLLSVPRILNTELQSIPDNVPYLSASQTKSKHFQDLLCDDAFNVGLVWQGNPDRQDDGMRSCPEAALSPLLAFEKAQFVSLQVGQSAPVFSSGVLDFGEKLKDFSDTAAAIDALDLVITVDTATAHLAGALGKSVWVMLGYHADWRYLMDRSDSPWYPTMRLFRQSQPGDWESLIDELVHEMPEHLIQFRQAPA